MKPQAASRPQLRVVTASAVRAGDGETLSGGRLLFLTWVVAGISVFAIFGWTALAPLDVGLTASGALDTESARRLIQHPEGGVLKVMTVRDGQAVRAGQTVALMEAEGPRLELELVRQQYFDRLGERAMLLADRTGQPIVWPAQFSDADAREDPLVKTVVAAQERLLADRRAARAMRKQVLLRQVNGLRSQAAGLRAQEESLRVQSALVAEEAQGIEELYRRGYAPKTRLLGLQRSEAGLRGEVGKARAAVSQSHAEASGAELEILNVDAAAHQETVQRLAVLDTEILALSQKYERQKQIFAHTSVKSPVDGVVLQRRISTAGNVVKPGETLLDIVPSDNIVVTAHVRPEDRDSVRDGMPATIHFTGLPVGTPQLKGFVDFISPDAFAATEGGARYFVVRVTVPKAERAKLGAAALSPGMPADVLLNGGRRTLLQHLLRPISIAFGRSFREG